MNNNEKHASVGAAKQMTPNQILAERWRLTTVIVALKGMVIPDTIEFQVEGARHIQATRVATLQELAGAIDSLNEAIEHRSDDKPIGLGVHRHCQIEDLIQQRDALVVLQDRVSRCGASASTTVIEALFPEVPVKKRTPIEKSERDQWLAVRKEEALKIDPGTAEVDWRYRQVLDPYGVLDEWELPAEFDCVGREYFARAPGSDIWVRFGDLPDETRKVLWERHRSKLAFPAGLEPLLEMLSRPSDDIAKDGSSDPRDPC
jgi:hypothetical protein